MSTGLDRARNWALGLWSSLALIYLFVPIFVIALFSFNDNKGRFNYTWQGFTLKHWKDPFSVEGLQSALGTSLLIGAVSKSAIFPFHFWLPGAMAAPTPVSAYLHAAAMVKAGIYLIARFAPIFALSARSRGFEPPS